MIVGLAVEMLKEIFNPTQNYIQAACQHWSIMCTRKNSNLAFIQVLSFSHSEDSTKSLFCCLDAGFKTCSGRTGSLRNETKDANTYAAWKVDFLKYDNCYDDGTKPEVRYPVMRDALNATGRPIFYSLCGMLNHKFCTLFTFLPIEWGVDQPALWAKDVGNSWRTTADLQDNWLSVLSNIDIVIVSFKV